MEALFAIISFVPVFNTLTNRLGDFPPAPEAHHVTGPAPPELPYLISTVNDAGDAVIAGSGAALASTIPALPKLKSVNCGKVAMVVPVGTPRLMVTNSPVPKPLGFAMSSRRVAGAVAAAAVNREEVMELPVAPLPSAEAPEITTTPSSG